MSAENIERKISDMLASQFSQRGMKVELKRTDSLISAGLLDSLTAIELIADLEKEFGINVKPEEMLENNFDSIEKIAGYVMRKNKEKSSG